MQPCGCRGDFLFGELLRYPPWFELSCNAHGTPRVQCSATLRGERRQIATHRRARAPLVVKVLALPATCPDAKAHSTVWQRQLSEGIRQIRQRSREWHEQASQARFVVELPDRFVAITTWSTSPATPAPATSWR